MHEKYIINFYHLYSISGLIFVAGVILFRKYYTTLRKHVIHHRFGDGYITLVFFLGFQLATGKESRFLYVFDKAGSQYAIVEDFRQSLLVYIYM